MKTVTKTAKSSTAKLHNSIIIQSRLSDKQIQSGFYSVLTFFLLGDFYKVFLGNYSFVMPGDFSIFAV